MMDCYYHHLEITLSKTSQPDAILDAQDGLALAREVLSCNLGEYNLEIATKSALASLLGGSSSIGGRVGASHAISYGLSNSSAKLPHSMAVTMAMLGLKQVYGAEIYGETLDLLKGNNMAAPRARDFGLRAQHIKPMSQTALGMEKLWLSHYGSDWQNTVTLEFLQDIYQDIVEA